MFRKGRRRLYNDRNGHDDSISNLRWDSLHFIFGNVAQSAGAVECTDYISAEGLDLYNERPVYETKKSDSEALVMLEFGDAEHPFTAFAPMSTVARNGSIW